MMVPSHYNLAVGWVDCVWLVPVRAGTNRACQQNKKMLSVLGTARRLFVADDLKRGRFEGTPRHPEQGDFDWYNETFIVRRRKGGPIQQFPIQHEVGEAIIRYLQTARPECRSRHLFVTQCPPYRPLRTVYAIISRRMKRLGIESVHVGPHSLRHACATALLRKGTALKDIASFLGHRNMDSVSIYAKYDSRMLRAVAAFSLGGVR